MELTSQLVSIPVMGLLALIFLIYIYQSKHALSKCSAPRAGGAWPIIGHLHHFRGRQLPHKLLGDMADKFGSVFTIKLGCHSHLVVSSWEIAKEVYTLHDKVFTARPSTISSKLLGFNNAMFGFTPRGGSYSSEIRKIATSELLSNGRLNMLKPITASEVEKAIAVLHKKWVVNGGENNGAVLMDMKQWFREVVHNVATRMVCGKRSIECDESESRRIQKVMKDVFHLLGVFVISEVIPFLGWFDLQGHEKAMKRTAKELDTIADGWLEKHRRKRLSSNEVEQDEQDFMDAMLNILGGSSIQGLEADIVIKATCMNLILGSTDTTSVTLTWALSLLLNNRHALKKVQDELDAHVGKNRHVDESDVKNLIYLQAVVKETLRLYPTVPVVGLRIAREDCTLSSGYHIPAGTGLLVNLWKMHRDENVWPDPHEFKPERFVTSHKGIDVRGQNFEFLPFGSGRRVCPGISLASQLISLTLASLLHCFEIASPNGEVVGMTGSAGLTNSKATPLEVLLTPRLGCLIYGGN